jgi:hypothetical protein
MDAHLFWFDDEQWVKIEPHLPKAQPGPQRKDDRRILSMHVLKAGCRWVDCPREYGPVSAEFGRRYSRWSRRRLSHRNRLRWIAPISKPIAVQVAERGVRNSGDRPHERRPQPQDPCDRRRESEALGADPDTRQHRRLCHGARLRQPHHKRHKRLRCYRRLR